MHPILGAFLLSVLSLQFNRDLFHFRIASVKEFFVALAEAVERGCAVDDRLSLTAASAAAEGIPVAFLAFLVAVGRYNDEFLCHIAANKLFKRILIYVAELPFVKNIKVAWEYASVALDNCVAGANSRHSAIFGRSAE